MQKIRQAKIITILFGVLISSGAFAGVKSQFKLEHVGKSKTPGFVSKEYSVNGPVKVTYEYMLDEMGGYQYALGLRLVDQGGIIPKDLKQAYLDAGGDGNKTVRSLGIHKAPKDGCYFKGTALVQISKISLDLPEYPTTYDSKVAVTKVISSSTPVLKCE